MDERTEVGSTVLAGRGGERLALVRIQSRGEGDESRAALHSAMRAALGDRVLETAVRLLASPGTR